MHAIPRMGHTVTARAGGALNFDDLIQEHVRVHGPLRKLDSMHSSSSSSSLTSSGGGNREETIVSVPRGVAGDRVWRSTPEERQLYSKIARRIEKTLLQLEAEARQDLGDRYPGRPDEAVAILRAGRGQGGGGGGENAGNK